MTEGISIHYQDHTYPICPECGNDSIIKQRNNYICDSCGVVLSTEPFSSQIQDQYYDRQGEMAPNISLSRSIGCFTELLNHKQSTHLIRLARLDARDRIDYNKKKDNQAKQILFNITKKLQYSISESLKKEILCTEREIRNSSDPYSRDRNPERTIPVLLFAFSRKRSFIINPNKLIEFSHITRREFYRELKHLREDGFLPKPSKKAQEKSILLFIDHFKNKFLLGKQFFDEVRVLTKRLNINGTTKHRAALITRIALSTFMGDVNINETAITSFFHDTPYESLQNDLRDLCLLTNITGFTTIGESNNQIIALKEIFLKNSCVTNNKKRNLKKSEIKKTFNNVKKNCLNFRSLNSTKSPCKEGSCLSMERNHPNARESLLGSAFLGISTFDAQSLVFSYMFSSYYGFYYFHILIMEPFDLNSRTQLTGKDPPQLFFSIL